MTQIRLIDNAVADTNSEVIKIAGGFANIQITGDFVGSVQVFASIGDESELALVPTDISDTANIKYADFSSAVGPFALDMPKRRTLFQVRLTGYQSGTCSVIFRGETI